MATKPDRKRKPGRSRRKPPAADERQATPAEGAPGGDLAFLHIPKTAGTAYADLKAAVAKQGYALPARLGHAWTLPRVIRNRPDMRLCVLIREPLERTVSAFSSRLRQGRPTYSVNWKPNEAAVFSIYRDVRAFLDALISDAEFDISASEYAMSNISHLRRRYAFYFRGPRLLKVHKARLAHVAHVENSEAFWKRLGRECGVPEDVIEANFVRSHVAPVAASNVLDGYSGGDIEKMKARLSREYEIYEVLKSLVNVPAR